MAVLKPFQLLEINVISAQDLEPISRKMKTYATTWMHPTRKLSTRVDKDGYVNPTWNDKFVFRVDEDFLREDTSAVQIEIYCVHWFRDTLVGSVRVLVGNLFPPMSRLHQHMGMRFVALQVRRPSGRPQGILNIGVTLLDSSMRSMPLYRQLSASAVGFRDLMAEEGLNNLHHKNLTQNQKPILRRTRSDRSDLVTFDKNSSMNSSIVGMSFINGPTEKGSSILSISYVPPPRVGMKKKGKASSVIGGAELRDRPNKGTFGKGSSVLSDSIVSKESSMHMAKYEKRSSKGIDRKVALIEYPGFEAGGPTTRKIVDEKSTTVSKGVGVGATKMAIGKPLPKYNGYEYGGPAGNTKYGRGGSVWSDSELGPSPFEKKYPLDDERSSVFDGWSLDESVEGLKSKLERWRTELPPIYDRGYKSTGTPHKRRHSDGGSNGMFSCFGNIYGYECQCVCGKPPEKKTLSARYQSPSLANRSFF